MTAHQKPMPDWGRPGETWRVAEERHLEVAIGGICTWHRGRQRCDQPSVAALRNGLAAYCRDHLPDVCWIEDGKVVSWRLGR